MSNSTAGRGAVGRATAIVAILSMMLGACANAGDDANLTPAEKALRAKTEDARTSESTATGAVAGALLGALLGAAIGSRSGNAGQGALIGVAAGGLAGAAAGYGYGSYTNARARRYSNAEARARAVSQGADDSLSYYNRINAAARTVLAEQQTKIARLNESYRTGALSKAQFHKELTSASSNETTLKGQLDGLDNQLGAMRSDPQSATLSRQIQQLQQQRDSLKDTYDRLIQLYGTVPSEVRAG
jgi:uncharacterized protein YcfJ